MSIDANPLLTIGIPVFNGARSILGALESVCSQRCAGVEILISDNASTDDTQQIVERYLAQYPFIRYMRNENNLGFAGNLDNLIKNAKGAFLWFLADDDIVSPGGINDVLQLISRYPEVGAIYVGRRKIHLTESMLCRGGDQFFCATSFGSGAVSSNVVKVSAWRDADLRLEGAHDWLHIEFLLKVLPHCDSVVSRRQLVYENAGLEKRWGRGGSFLEVGQRFASLAKLMDPGLYSAKTRKAALWAIKGTYFVHVPRAKAQGFSVNRAFLQRSIRLFGGFVSFWLIDLPLLLTPRIIFVWIWSLYEFSGIRRMYHRWGPLF